MSKRFSITSSTERFFGAESLVLSRSTSQRNPTVRSSARPSVSVSYPSPASWPSSTASCRGCRERPRAQLHGGSGGGSSGAALDHTKNSRQSPRFVQPSSGTATVALTLVVVSGESPSVNLNAHHAPVRYGYRRPGVWLVFPEVFHSEFCSGLDHKRVADVARGQRARGRR